MYRVTVVAAFALAVASPSEVEAAGKRTNIAQPPGCTIKGNVGRKNLRLYYIPDHPRYKSVKITKSGERWFCSESDARQAGWKSAGTYRQGLPVRNQQDYRVPDDAPVGCTIKGNVAQRGRNHGVKRYHLLGSPRYAETIVRKEQGDRWFCTIAAARAAGFEAAGTFAGKTGHDQRDCAIPTDLPEEARLNRCFIKGNISRSGRIYHVLGSRHYAETTITLQRGERWFCTTTEAAEAGWRAPKRSGKNLTCGLAGVADRTQ